MSMKIKSKIHPDLEVEIDNEDARKLLKLLEEEKDLELVSNEKYGVLKSIQSAIRQVGSSKMSKETAKTIDVFCSIYRQQYALYHHEESDS